VRSAARVLQTSPLSFRFHGFIEGDDIGRGTVDVVVTDGFTGNIALKTMEGTARVYTQILKETLASSWLARFGALLARPALRNARKRVDPRFYNGAMFLGLNGVCVKSHGGTDALGFANALGVAVDLVADRVNEGIRMDFACMASAGSDVAEVTAG
jgi:glycerol-3-phosphate acyltransferase PlsX